MTRNDSTRFSELKSRVEALGHKLVTYPGLLDQNRSTYTGLYILNPTNGEIVIVSAGSREDDDHEIAGWCESRERDIAGALPPMPVSDAVAADFNSPALGRVYEEFLTLLVLVDRVAQLDAMDIRKRKGVEAALEFVKACPVMQEANEAYREVYDDAHRKVSTARALVDMICMNEGNSNRSIEIVAFHTWEVLGDVLKEMEKLNPFRRPLEGGAA